jgi:hypothetical protein
MLAFPLAGAVLTKNDGLPSLAFARARCGCCSCGWSGGQRGPRRRVARALGRAAALLAPAALLLGAWWGLAASLGLPLQFMKPEAGVETTASRGQLARLSRTRWPRA